jgi:hypothetical protein
MAKKLSAFEKEFAAARNRGDLKFDFNGKSYTTRRADDPPNRELGMRATPADTSGFTAGRDKPRSGGANVPTPSRKTKPAPLSKETEDEVYRMFGKPTPSEKRAKAIQDRKDDVRLQASGYRDTDGGFARRQASFSPAVTSLSYDEAKIKRLGRGASTVDGDKAEPKPKPKRLGRGLAAGGKVEKESKGMMKKEIAFFKKKKAPKSMIKHEEKEAKGMNCGGKVMKYAKGGSIDGLSRVKTKGKVC